MNIIIVQEWFEKSASFKHIVHFANLMVKKGHKVLLVNHLDKGSPYDDTKEVLFDYETCKLKINKLEKNFEHLIKSFKPDIVHSFCNRYEAYIAVLIKKATGAKLIVHYEDNFEQVFFNHIPFLKGVKLILAGLFFLDIWFGYNLLLEMRLRKYFDGYDVLTKPLKKLLEDKLVNKPIRHIYPPIDLEFFRPRLDGSHIRKELNIDDKFVFLHTGTVYGHWTEGYDKFLNALALAKKYIPNLVLVSTGRPVGNADALYKIIEKYGLNDTFINKGYVKNFSDIPLYLAMSDVLFEPQCLYNYDEYRLPSKLHNYMAVGKPIMTFSNGFARELSDDEVVKIDFQNESAEDICNKIVYLYKNPDFRNSLGINARRKAEELFNMDKQTEKLLEFYDYILNS